MPTDILVSSDPWENRVAILEDGKLSEIYVERDERVIGSIYKAKVVNVLPGMGAAFVDIGLGRNAFLYVDDINKTPLNIGDVEVTAGRQGYTITEKVNRGDEILVQIVKEPRGLKGARVSTNISLPGRYLILMPTGRYSGVSRKVESGAERERLKAIMKAIRPEGMATVIRTAASGVSNAELIADLGVLIRMWHGILEQFKRVAAPALLHKDMNLVFKTARDFITPDVGNVWIDNAEEAEAVRDFMRLLGPQYVDRIKYYPGGKTLFNDYKVDEEIGRLMKPTVKLPAGGSIVIESTEALTVVDVNSGKTAGRNLDDTIVRTNIEAATEIARQVRLRDIGGIIVCDFIDMSSEADRNKVVRALEEGLKRDRTRTTIQSFSSLGLLEFTRKRIGKDLSQQLRGACPTCSGLGSVLSPESVTIQTFRKIDASKNGSVGGTGIAKPIHVHATPQVAAQMTMWYDDELEGLRARLGAPIDVRVDAGAHPERPRVVIGADPTPPPPPVRVGDEFDVDLLSARLPNATSALAVINGRLVEVEGAAGAVGSTIKIRVIDVDDESGEVLAEPRVPVPGEEGAPAKKRRRRGGKGRKKPLTAAEQADELRELAEEAAQGLGARAIGISTTDEAVAEELVHKNEGEPKHPTPAAAVPVNGSHGVVTPGERGRGGRGDRDRGDRGERGGRGRGPRDDAPPAAPPSAPPAAAGAVMPLLPGESLSGALVRLPGETLSGALASASAPAPRSAPPPPPRATVPAARPAVAEDEDGDDDVAATSTDAAGEGGKRRRRRRRRGRGGNGTASAHEAPGTSTLAPAAAVVPAGSDDEEDDDDEAAPAASTAPLNGDGPRRKRRRRRRRRGGIGGAESGEAVAASEPSAMPDRHIFRVDGDGAAHPTGETAPPSPSRAIAPWNRSRGDIALEPPPPVLTAPSDDVKVATRARRGRGSATPARAAGQLEAVAAPKALPAPAAEESTPRRTSAATVTRKATATRKTASARKTAVKAEAKAPARKAAAAKKVTAKAASPARKATAAKATAPKAAAVKATATKKTSAAKKTPARKAATTRKKS